MPPAPPSSSSSVTSSYSAGSERSRKRSFEELILPPLQLSAGAPPSKQESPYFFDYSAKIKRARTTSPSPRGLHEITPTTSPAAQHANIVSLSSEFSSIFSSPLFNANTPSISLPPLKHLRLLPHPSKQTFSSRFPDTCERTQQWRDRLEYWCKEAERARYKDIATQVSEPVVKDLQMLASAAYVSSIVSAKDHFYELSNTSVKENIAITPPLSPKTSPRDPEGNVPLIKFSTAISEKLVQTIREKRISRAPHKKTNSCQARELKKLLESRSMFRSTSHSPKRVEKPRKGHQIVAKSPVTQQFVNDGVKTDTICPVQKKTPTTAAPPHDSLKVPYVTPTDPWPTSLPVENSPSIRKSKDLSTSICNIIPVDTGNTTVTPARPASPPMSSKSSARRPSVRKCLSCQCTDSPCWRPSWSDRKQDQLCNSCGLRYKKTQTRCVNPTCLKIPSKGELALMKANPKVTQVKDDGTLMECLRCLYCNNVTETKE
ncbi:HCL192Wp [Eremothecium sinecaudum]|uniref:HCL192Wp n=1 Tax=Eremothecium sinecaudum TaxID=45286 RepID=A0A0X8HR80_9SACH|nr:HCL192Wp [Eremothecium sinecaudum]AMD19959.1 HCL192Wp [Eremothecium sinecaudum]